MTKCDLTVEKSITINTNNFDSIKPSISLTIKDIDIKDIQKIHTELNDNILPILLFNEIEQMNGVQNDIHEIGINNLIKSLNKEQMNDGYKKSIKRIINE